MDKLTFQHPQTPGLVSVIIPTRNGDRFIGAALESVADQAYDQWEVIVIEDGSHGETEAIVRRFAAAHPSQRVHYQRNEASRGAAYTRNRCFELAGGQFIAFLDCDDRWLPGHLAACVGAMNESGDDVAFSAAAMCQDGDDYMLGFWGPTPDEMRQFPRSLLGRSFVTPSATVVRRDLVEQVGAWNSDFKYCEDADFFLRAARLEKRFRCLGGVHCLYRKNHAGATTQKLAGTIEEYATLSSWYVDRLGGLPKHTTRMVARSFAAAAKMHARHDRVQDPSATRSRAAPLYFQAWRLRPKRIGYLLNAAWHAAIHGWSRNNDLPTDRQRHETTDTPAPAAARAAA